MPNRLEKWSVLGSRLGFYGLMAAGLWLMLSASVSYLDLASEHPFFLAKLPLEQPELWLGALYAHVPSALLSLPACLVLLIGRVRSRFPRFHRWLGRVTGGVILLIVVPSGMYLALFAEGGLPSTFGFWLTGAITFVAMLKSIRSARDKDMKAHRRFSTHVVAQLSVAVISRFLLAGADLADVYAEWVYIAALWVPIVGCALVAELLTGPRLFSPSKGSRRETLSPAARLDALR
jgi:hypothetical protein